MLAWNECISFMSRYDNVLRSKTLMYFKIVEDMCMYKRQRHNMVQRYNVMGAFKKSFSHAQITVFQPSTCLAKASSNIIQASSNVVQGKDGLRRNAMNLESAIWDWMLSLTFTTCVSLRLQSECMSSV